MFNLTWDSKTETNALPEFWNPPTRLHSIKTQKTPIFYVFKPQTNIILPVTVFTNFNNYICFISVITGISLSSVGARDNNLELNTKRSWVWQSHSVMKKVMCPVWHTLCYIINSKNKMIKMAPTPAITTTQINCWRILQILTQLLFSHINILHTLNMH